MKISFPLTRTLRFSLLLLGLWTALAWGQKIERLSVSQITDLLKNSVSPNRIARFIEDHGIAFDLDEQTLQQLKNDGANETVLAAVRKMATRNVDDRQRRQLAEEVAKKRNAQAEEKARVEVKKIEEETKRLRAELERRQQEEARRIKEEAQRRAQEEARIREEENKRKIAEARQIAEAEERERAVAKTKKQEAAMKQELDEARKREAEAAIKHAEELRKAEAARIKELQEALERLKKLEQERQQPQRIPEDKKPQERPFLVPPTL